MNRVGAYGALNAARFPHLDFIRRSIAGQRGAPTGSGTGTLKHIAHGLEVTAALYVGGGLDVGTGDVVLCPASAERFLHFDWTTDTFRFGDAHGMGGAAYSGLVPVDEELMVCVPSAADFIGFYNPRTKVFAPGPGVGSTASNLFSGGALTANGAIVMAPKAHGFIGVLDAASGRYRDGPANPSAGGYAGVIPLDGDWALLVPDGSGPLVKFNPSTNVLQATTSPNLVQCKSGITAPDGRVTLTSHDATRLLRYDLKFHTYTASATQISSDADKFWGAALLPDGKIFWAPYNFGRALIVDPVAGTWADGPAFTGTQLHAGAIALPDGRVLCVPFRSSNLSLYTHLTGGQGLPRDALTSRFFNTAF